MSIFDLRMRLFLSALACCFVSQNRFAMAEAAALMDISAITDLAIVRIKDGAVADPTPVLSQSLWQNVDDDAPTLMFVVRRPG